MQPPMKLDMAMRGPAVAAARPWRLLPEPQPAVVPHSSGRSRTTLRRMTHPVMPNQSPPYHAHARRLGYVPGGDGLAAPWQ